MSPDPGLSESSGEVLEQFAAARGGGSGSVRLLAGEVRHFLAYLNRAGRGSLGAVTVDDVPGVHGRDGTQAACGHRQRGVVAQEVLRLPQRRRAQRRPRRRPARACRAAAGAGTAVLYPETGRLLEGIETGTPCGKRDYAMVMLAVSTGLRCCASSRCGWTRSTRNCGRDPAGPGQDIQAAGTAAASPGRQRRRGVDPARPAYCDAPEVFVRLKAPLVKLGNSTGSTLMRRRLARAGIDHAARDGKSFHALRRTTGTRLIESGAGLPLAAQPRAMPASIPPS